MAGRRQRRRKEKAVRHSQKREGRSDVIQLPTGYIARRGRFLEMRKTGDWADQLAFAEAFVEGADDLREERAAKRSRLIEILVEADPVEVLTRASLTYLQIDPDTYREWEDDRSPAHLEYLALQGLSVGIDAGRGCDPVRAMQLTLEATDLVREIFSDTTMLLIMEGVRARQDADGVGDPLADYQFRTRLQSLGVRGSSYAEHTERVVAGCFGPLDRECRELLGFTGSEAFTMILALQDVFESRLAPVWEESAAGRKLLLAELKRRRRKPDSDGVLPEWLVAMPLVEARVQVSMMALSYMFANARSLAVIEPGALATAADVSVATADRFLDAFSCTANDYQSEHHEFPFGGQPLTTKPVFKIGTGYLLPVPQSLLEALRPRMEDLIAHEDVLWERYSKVRGAGSGPISGANRTARPALRGPCQTDRVWWVHNPEVLEHRCRPERLFSEEAGSVVYPT